MRSILWGTGKRLLLLAGSLIVALILIEILLRVVQYSPAFRGPLNAFHQADEKLGWIGIPNLSARFKTPRFDAMVSTDEEGFRVVSSTVEPSPGAPEVWLFGDSGVWGWGVSDGDLFADILQEKAGKSLRIRNFGMNAYGTLQQAFLLERLLAERKTAPARVIVLVFKNDFADNLTDQGGARPHLRRSETSGEFEITNVPVKRKIGGLSAKLARSSYAWGFLSYCSSMVKQLRKRGKYENYVSNWTEQAEVGPQGVDPDPLGEEQFGAVQFALAKMHQMCKDKGADLSVIAFPDPTTPYAKTAASLALEKICKDLGADVVDIESGMTENRIQYFIGEGDDHWNEAGNRKAAEILIDHLGPGLGL